jgi:hypothetical protein
VGKFRGYERLEVQSIVADLTIKRIPDKLIIKHIENKTGQTITDRSLRNIRQRIKKESYDCYSKLREGKYEYIHEFKERVNEVVDLQRRHYKIIDDNANNPGIQQASLIALHKLNVTLSNYFDIVPYLTTTGQRQSQKQIERQTLNAQAESNGGQIRISPAGHHTRMSLAENCQCILNGVSTDTVRHIECRSCLHIWCPNALGGQDWCPNPECIHGIRGNEFQPYDENYDWVKCNCERWFKTQEILQAHLNAYPHYDASPV